MQVDGIDGYILPFESRWVGERFDFPPPTGFQMTVAFRISGDSFHLWADSNPTDDSLPGVLKLADRGEIPPGPLGTVRR
ncbi:hypothetical protein TNCV_1400591 [Trichonephila clavipes]|nr:hypothetical protein TNCV_1400591 [Trichonephila clavipes]